MIRKKEKNVKRTFLNSSHSFIHSFEENKVKNLRLQNIFSIKL